MLTKDNSPTVLVPIDLSEEEQPDPGVLELLHPAKVVLLGWYPVPDQTAPEQLQEEQGDEAVERLEGIASEFPEGGADVETVVVFTHDRATTVDRVADEYGCGVVLVPEDVRVVGRVLVLLRSDVNLDRLLGFAGVLLEESEASVTLFHAVSDDEDPSVGEVLLKGAAEELADAGVDTDRIDTVNVNTGSPTEEVVDAATNHDVVILGETEPSLVENILGDVPTRIIEKSGRPVLVVRDLGEDEDGDEGDG